MTHHARPPPGWEENKNSIQKEELMTRTHPPWRRRLISLFCAFLLFGGIIAVPVRAADQVTVSTTECTNYFEVYNAAYQWALIETPQHAINETGQVAYCLQQAMKSPYNSGYHYLYGQAMYDQTILNGLRAILEHGYPTTNGGFPDDQARYATANAIRFWLAERGAPGVPSWLNYSTNSARLRGAKGYEALFDWSISLLHKARNQECASHSISLSANELTLTQSGDYFVGSVTVNHSGLNGGYVLDSAQFPSGSVTGYTGNAGDVLQFKIPSSYANQSFGLTVIGKDTRTEAAMFYYEPDTSGEQRVVAYSADVYGNTGTDFLTVKTPSAQVRSITIHKQDSVTGKPLAGAYFCLFDKNNVIYGMGTTDESGNLLMSYIPNGTYIAVEQSAPSGYNMDNRNTEIVVSDANPNVTVTITNSPITGTLLLYKESSKNSAKLAGAGYRVYDSTGAQVAEGYTDSDGRLDLTGLPLGDLTYAEFDAPDGYVLDTTKYPFTLTSKNSKATVTVKNDPIEGSLTIIKLDSATEEPLAGAGFRLYNANGAQMGEGYTNENGELIFSGLSPGDYSYAEFAPPTGYTADSSKQSFTVTEMKSDVLVTVRNDPALGSIAVHKVNANGTPVQGVSFLLESSTDGGGWTAVETKTTDSSGNVKYSDLNAATNVRYRLTETSSTPGLSLQENHIFTGTLTENRDLTFTVCNTGVTALPFTGSSGFLFIPVIFLMLGVWILVLQRRRDRSMS